MKYLAAIKKKLRGLTALEFFLLAILIGAAFNDVRQRSEDPPHHEAEN